MRADPVHVFAAVRGEPKTISIVIDLDVEEAGEPDYLADAEKINEVFGNYLPGQTMHELRVIMSGLSHLSTEILKREVRRREKEEQWRKYPEHRRMMTYNGTRSDMLILQAIENRISRGYFGESEEQRSHDQQFLWERGIDIQFLEIEKRVMLTKERE